MSDHTKIEWTEATWNPVTGCAKVSQGCKHCYAERDWARLSANPKTRYFGRKFTDVACHEDVLELPLRWSKPRRIFVNSMSDLFHPDVPDEFIRAVFATMAAARQHTFQVLTKRPERMLGLLDLWDCAGVTLREGCGVALPNVWLGVSAENQETLDERARLLLQTPAAVRWISAEPLLGPVDCRAYLQRIPCYCHDGGLHPRIDWVVVGGESGPHARPMHPDWARALRDQCAAVGVPFLFKQWGEWAPYDRGSVDGAHLATTNALDTPMQRLGKKAAGRLLDGVQHDGYPA